tara:strand:- start:2758 stop:3252 length:495 start_codon:yes stop_codon:yes gene_type:complete
MSLVINNPLVSELLVFTLYKVIKSGDSFDGFHSENLELKPMLKRHIMKSLEHHNSLSLSIAPMLSLGSQDVLLTSITLACFAEQATLVSESFEGASRNDKIKIKATSMLLQALAIKSDVIIDMYFNTFGDIPSKIEGNGSSYVSKLARSINRNMSDNKLLVGAL